VRALDTNVLVRYLTRDDARQFRAAEAMLKQSTAAGEPLFISMLVLCETVWVLDRSYEQPKASITTALEALMDTALLVIEREDLVRQTVEQWRRGRGNFSDYVIGNIAREAGCSETVTFDRALTGEEGFAVPR
jgi:predicted nucleic-acid-binding protein